MRVLILESDSLVTAALKHLVEKTLGFEVVSSGSGKKSWRKSHKNADAALIYLGLQEPMGQLARALKLAPGPAVVITPNLSKEHAAQVLQNGALGLVPQTASPQELEKAIRSASAGKLFLSGLLPAPVRQFAKKALAGERTPFERLTDRQRQILKLIAEGKNTKEIAHRLKVSVKTIEFHRVRLMNRLEIYNVPSLVRFAIRCGLVRFDV